eukprot:m.157502 g.157502  ORF g.157502 m.157502 type:complete len:140 (-) comp15120_c0_seq1:1271-1690(-)
MKPATQRKMPNQSRPVDGIAAIRITSMYVNSSISQPSGNTEVALPYRPMKSTCTISCAHVHWYFFLQDQPSNNLQLDRIQRSATLNINNKPVHCVQPSAMAGAHPLGLSRRVAVGLPVRHLPDIRTLQDVHNQLPNAEL